MATAAKVPAVATAAAKPRALTDADFGAAVARDAALVLFTAPWCAPCGRAIEAMSQVQVPRGVPVMTAALDDNQDNARVLKLAGVPCLVLFRAGTPAARLLGARSPQAVTEWIKKAMAGEA